MATRAQEVTQRTQPPRDGVAEALSPQQAAQGTALPVGHAASVPSVQCSGAVQRRESRVGTWCSSCALLELEKWPSLSPGLHTQRWTAHSLATLAQLHPATKHPLPRHRDRDSHAIPVRPGSADSTLPHQQGAAESTPCQALHGVLWVARQQHHCHRWTPSRQSPSAIGLWQTGEGRGSCRELCLRKTDFRVDSRENMLPRVGCRTRIVPFAHINGRHKSCCVKLRRCSSVFLCMHAI